MSNETRWTPGPWRVGTHGPNGCYTVGTVGGLMTAMVAHSVNYEDQEERAVGDAHLIAAAPELYEALKSLVRCIDETRGSNANDALHAAETALAKARGEQS